MHPNFNRVNQEKNEMKQSTKINRGKTNTTNIINDNTFNLHNSHLNYDNRYIKVTLESKLIVVAR